MKIAYKIRSINLCTDINIQCNEYYIHFADDSSVRLHILAKRQA